MESAETEGQEEHMKLGEKIYALRTKHNMTQEALAEEIGVSRQSVSKWESGITMPELDKLKLLAELFAVSWNDLLGEIAAEDETSLRQQLEQELEQERTNAEQMQKKWKKLKTSCIGISILSILLIAALIVMAVNLSALQDEISILETQTSQVIYSNPDDDDYEEAIFEECSYDVTAVDQKKQTMDLMFQCMPKDFTDSTKISITVRKDDSTGETEPEKVLGSGVLINEDGMFRGAVTVPVVCEEVDIKACIDQEGKKKNVTIYEEEWLLGSVDWMPALEIHKRKAAVSGGKYVFAGDIYIGPYEGLSAREISDVVLTISKNGKVLYEKRLTKTQLNEIKNGMSPGIEYALEIKGKSGSDLEEDWAAFDVFVNYSNSVLGRELSAGGPADFGYWDSMGDSEEVYEENTVELNRESEEYEIKCLN